MAQLTPGELESLVDERARQIVQREKEAVAREAAEAKERARLEELESAVAAARRALDEFWIPAPRGGKRRLGRPSAGSLWRFVLCLTSVFTFCFVMVSPYVPWTPAAIACPFVCEGCAMATRSSHQGAGDSHMLDTATVCKNPRVDIDELSGWQLLSDARLEPYKLNIALRFAIDFLIFLLLAIPSIGGFLTRRGWAKRDVLESALRRAEAELSAAQGGPPGAAGEEPYR